MAPHSRSLLGICSAKDHVHRVMPRAAAQVLASGPESCQAHVSSRFLCCWGASSSSTPISRGLHTELSFAPRATQVNFHVCESPKAPSAMGF